MIWWKDVTKTTSSWDGACASWNPAVGLLITFLFAVRQIECVVADFFFWDLISKFGSYWRLSILKNTSVLFANCERLWCVFLEPIVSEAYFQYFIQMAPERLLDMINGVFGEASSVGFLAELLSR